MDDDDMKPEVKEGTRKGKNRTCIPLANRVPHTHTHTRPHTHPHTHTQRHIHYMPHYSPDLPINASLRGPPCSGVYIYIYIWPLFRALLPVQETNDPYPVLGHDVLRFFAFFSRGRRQGALALKFGIKTEEITGKRCQDLWIILSFSVNYFRNLQK